jgi:predicted nucleic acid-binding protein
VLPDFLLGAQASTMGAPVLTRDARMLAAHFPDVKVIELG